MNNLIIKCDEEEYISDVRNLQNMLWGTERYGWRKVGMKGVGMTWRTWQSPKPQRVRAPYIIPLLIYNLSDEMSHPNLHHLFLTSLSYPSSWAKLEGHKGVAPLHSIQLAHLQLHSLSATQSLLSLLIETNPLSFSLLGLLNKPDPSISVQVLLNKWLSWLKLYSLSQLIMGHESFYESIYFIYKIYF